MNVFEKQQVDAIIDACWRMDSGIHNDVAWMGHSVAGKIADFHGDCPSPGNFKVESVSNKAELLRRYSNTDFDKYSQRLFDWLPSYTKLFLIAPQRLQVILRKTPSGKLVAEFLDLDYQQYREVKKKYRRHVLKLDKVLRPHVYFKKDKTLDGPPKKD